MKQLFNHSQDGSVVQHMEEVDVCDKILLLEALLEIKVDILF